MGLAAPGLPIREQRDIVTVESALHELRHLGKHLLLRRARVESAVKPELAVVSVVGNSDAADLLVNAQYASLVAGAHARKDADVALELLQLVVQLAPRVVSAHQLLLQLLDLALELHNERLVAVCILFCLK